MTYWKGLGYSQPFVELLQPQGPLQGLHVYCDRLMLMHTIAANQSFMFGIAVYGVWEAQKLVSHSSRPVVNRTSRQPFVQLDMAAVSIRTITNLHAVQ